MSKYDDVFDALASALAEPMAVTHSPEYSGAIHTVLQSIIDVTVARGWFQIALSLVFLLIIWYGIYYAYRFYKSNKDSDDALIILAVGLLAAVGLSIIAVVTTYNGILMVYSPLGYVLTGVL